MNFETKFTGDAETPLSENGAWDATNINKANNAVAGNSSAVVRGVALVISPVSTDKNHYSRIVATSQEEQQAQIIVVGVTPGATTLITLASAHGRTGWGFVTLAGITLSTGAVSLTGTFICDYDTSTTSLTLQVDSSSSTYTIPSPSTATCDPADGHIDLFGRVAAASTSASFAPASGYVFRLSYENGGVRKLRFLRYDMGSAGTLVELKASADVGSAGTTVLTNLNVGGTTDIGIGQDMRFYVEDLRNGNVRLRGYLNDLDDESPNLEFTDQGDDGSSLSVAPLSMPREDAAKPGFQFFNEKMIAIYFEASDYATEELESLRPHGITLATIRSRVKLRLERSTAGVLTDDFYSQIINEAQNEIIEKLGYLAMFMRRTKALDLVSEEDGPAGEIRFTLGRDVKMIQNVRATNTTRELDWVFRQHQDEGKIQIELSTQDGGAPYEMVYTARTPEMTEDTDTMVLPREFIGCLIQLAIMKGAQYHSDDKLEKSAMREFNRLYSIFANSMSKIIQQSRKTEKFQGRARRQIDRYVPAWQRWGSFVLLVCSGLLAVSHG